MSNDNVPQHSGSRWEPAVTAAAPTDQLTSAPSSFPPSVDSGDEKGRRRRRGPLLAVLAAVLALGASTAGIAYVHAAQEPSTSDPAALTDSPQDRGGEGSRADHRHGHGGGDARAEGNDSTSDGLPS